MPKFCDHGRRREECGLCNGSAIYRRHTKSAERRGYSNELSDARYRWLASLPCAYCGEPAGGVDRVKSDYGYTVLNSVPCCFRCNSMKSAKPAPVFIAAAHAVTAYSSTYESFKTRWTSVRTGGPDLCLSTTSNVPDAGTGSSSSFSGTTLCTARTAGAPWNNNSPDRAGSGQAVTEKEAGCDREHQVDALPGREVRDYRC